MKRILGALLVIAAAGAAIWLLTDLNAARRTADARDAASPPPTAGASAVLGARKPRDAAGEEDLESDFPTGVVRGRVHDASGAPIATAQIRIVSENSPQSAVEGSPVTTDGAGSFEIEAAGGSSFTLCASAPGHAPCIAEHVRLGDDVDLELAGCATLDGLALDADGKPVVGASIVLGSLGPIELVRTATSGAEGKWQISEIPLKELGSTWISAQAEGFAPFLTSELSWAKLAPITQFTVILRRGGAITGIVTDAVTEKPIPGARVEIGRRLWGMPLVSGRPLTVVANASMARGLGTVQTVTTDSAGEFRLASVPPTIPPFFDDLWWEAGASGYAAARDSLPRAGDGRPASIGIKLRPAGVVKARVVDQFGRPVRGAHVFLQVRFDTSWVSERGAGGALTAADGTFRLEGIPGSPEEVTLAVRKESGQRGQTVAGPGSVPAGRETLGPDIVMPLFPAAWVRVREVDGRPVSGAIVEVENSSSDMTRWFTLPDGRALVSFERYGDQGKADPAFVRVRASGFVDQVPASFIPDAGKPPEVEVTLVRAAGLRCRVVWKDGSDAAGITVGVAKGSVPVARTWPVRNEPPADEGAADAGLAFAQTDDRGKCAFGALPAPPWHLAAWLDPQDDEPVVRLESIADASREILIRIDEDRPAAAAQDEQVDVEVTVVDAVSGRPVLDASVTIDYARGLAVAPGVYRSNGVRRQPIDVFVFSGEYPGNRRRVVDLRKEGSERIEFRLEPGVTVRGRAKLPPGIEIQGTGAMISCNWGKGGKSCPLSETGDFEIRGVSPGVAGELLIQLPGRGFPWNFVPRAFRPVSIPSGVRELELNLEFVAAAYLGVTAPILDPWDLTVSASDGSWTREWKVSGSYGGYWIPIGPGSARCQVPGFDPVIHTYDLKTDYDSVSFVLK